MSIPGIMWLTWGVMGCNRVQQGAGGCGRLPKSVEGTVEQQEGKVGQLCRHEVSCGLPGGVR